VRDPDNTRKQLWEVLAGTDWEGLHPHAFRHLVATRLDAAGLTAREIADDLGHERISMTQDLYMSRRAGGSKSTDLDVRAPGRIRTNDPEIASRPVAVFQSFYLRLRLLVGRSGQLWIPRSAAPRGPGHAHSELPEPAAARGAE
jgi:hypothetical protein